MAEIRLDFFDTPDSHFGSKAEVELLKLADDLEERGVRITINKRDVDVPANKEALDRYTDRWVRKKFNPKYPAVVPLVVLKDSPLFFGYHPDMRRMIADKILE